MLNASFYFGKSNLTGKPWKLVSWAVFFFMLLDTDTLQHYKQFRFLFKVHILQEEFDYTDEDSKT